METAPAASNPSLTATLSAPGLPQGRRLTRLDFRPARRSCITAHDGGWRSAKHKQQWPTLKTYADPVFGNLPAQAVDATLVMRVLDSIWRMKKSPKLHLHTPSATRSRRPTGAAICSTSAAFGP
jgi:hypothetical protein